MRQATWQPLAPAERFASLDVLRGLALFGVLLGNLLTGFRVSLADHILAFHTHPGWANHLVDVLAAGLVEFKAFALFSMLFGAGVAVQAERAAARGLPGRRFLARRFLVLLALGLVHMSLIWNGDILALYAVCGLLLIPLLRCSTPVVAGLAALAVVLPYFAPLPIPFPSAEALRAQAEAATRVYREGGFAEILVFRAREALSFILPLLGMTALRTLGLMLFGIAAWRSGILREPEKRRTLVIWMGLAAGACGAVATALHVYSQSTGRALGAAAWLADWNTNIPLALAYAAAVLLHPALPLRAALADAGRMALTHYLTQSLLLGFVFYGYGLGLFGQLGAAPAALIGIALYAAQVALSPAWLRRYRFGPCEWLWRSLTYGRRQPFRRAA